jgi:hypothetical protein
MNHWRCSVVNSPSENSPYNGNDIQDEITKRTNPVNICPYCTGNVLSLNPLSVSLKVRFCKTIILSLVLLDMKNNLRKIFCPKKDKTSEYLG